MVKMLRAQIEVGETKRIYGEWEHLGRGQEWDESELCSVIVGTGNQHFCAGGDVKSMYMRGHPESLLAQCTGEC